MSPGSDARYRAGTAVRRFMQSWRERPPRLRAPLFSPDRELARIVERCRRAGVDQTFALASYESHQPVLLALLRAVPDARVLELGTGYGSTPLVLGLSGRSLSLETDPTWRRRYSRYASEAHRIELWQDFDQNEWRCPYFSESWDVALVDNSPGTTRQRNLEQLAASTRFIVCHDTQECFGPAASNFGWDFSTFPHVWTYTRFTTYTTVVSRTHAIPLDCLPGVCGQPTERKSA